MVCTSPTFHVLSIIIHLIMHEIVPLKIRMCSFALNIYIDVKIKIFIAYRMR